MSNYKKLYEPTHTQFFLGNKSPPVVDSSEDFYIEEGRHPVVSKFVPNFKVFQTPFSNFNTTPFDKFFLRPENLKKNLTLCIVSDNNK